MKKCFIYFLLFSLAFAHKLNVFYDIENGKIVIYSYFSDGKPLVNGRVKLIDALSGKVILKGKTNKEGIFICNFLPPSNYKIVVEGKFGHRGVTEILKEDILDFSDNTSFENQGKFFVDKNKIKKDNIDYSKNLNLTTFINNQELILKKLSQLESRLVKLEAQNNHIKKTLLKLQKTLSKPSLIEILGGIGWILGIFGGIAFFVCKKK